MALGKLGGWDTCQFQDAAVHKAPAYAKPGLVSRKLGN